MCDVLEQVKSDMRIEGNLLAKPWLVIVSQAVFGQWIKV